MSFSESRLEPEERGQLLASIARIVPFLAALALLFGFVVGQFLQAQFADVTARLELSRQAVNQFDELVSIASDLAARAQDNLAQVFQANGEQIEPAKPMEKASEGDGGGEGGGAKPSPAPPAPPLPASAMKGVDQLREAYGAVVQIQQALDTQVEVPDDSSMDMGLVSAASAAKKAHVRKVALPPASSSGWSFRLVLLVGFVVFLGILTLFCLWMYAKVTSPAARSLYEKLSYALVTFFIVATVGMFGAFLGVKIVLPTS